MTSASVIFKPDGIHALVPCELMDADARKLRDAYAIKPGAPFCQREFGFMEQVKDNWTAQGFHSDLHAADEFKYDRYAKFHLGGLGWCEAAFWPSFEEKLIEDRGEHEVVQDAQGRHLLCFKEKRQGFMPEYLDHPVKDMATWENDCKWRLLPENQGRFDNLEGKIASAREAAGRGDLITQNLVGGYMYLRSLMGPEALLYKFCLEPELIHVCMKSWFELSDAVIARHQQYVTIDEVFFAEDICYNNGPLISPDMIHEFLFPYYQQLITNIRGRQLDKQRHMYIQVDTDGQAGSVIDLYMEIGMDTMSPFEVASGCDVVEIGRQYPDLIMSGGVDKRILAEGKDAIDKMVDRIFPVMMRRGGYIPTCDHMVPGEVSLENYRHYRKRCFEF